MVVEKSKKVEVEIKLDVDKQAFKKRLLEDLDKELIYVNDAEDVKRIKCIIEKLEEIDGVDYAEGFDANELHKRFLKKYPFEKVKNM